MENIGEAPQYSTESNSKRNILIGITVLSIVSAIASAVAEYGNEPAYNAVSLFSTIGYGVGILLWCKADSNERNIGIFTLIYYLFKSRGFKNGLISVGYTFLFILALLVVDIVVNVAASLISGKPV